MTGTVDDTYHVLVYGRCAVGCGSPGSEPHECPYASELDGDLGLCNCCDLCTEQCAHDI